MIELRWYYKSNQLSHKLQFRTMINFEEIGLQDPVWSEWENVPNHFETPDATQQKDAP